MLPSEKKIDEAVKFQEFELEQANLQNQKQKVIIDFANAVIQSAIKELNAFKDLLQDEIREMLGGTQEGVDRPSLADGKDLRFVNQNVHKPKNLEKGLLKNRNAEQEKKVTTQSGSSLPSGMKTIHPAHDSFNMVVNIMLGIKKAVDSTLDYPLLKVTDKDFKIKCQYELAPFKTGNAEEHVKACTFQDYAPQVFS